MGYETIKINGTSFPRPPEFSPGIEDVLSAVITTMTGKKIADKIGWKYSDMTLKWEYLPEDLVIFLNGLNGSFTIEFDIPGTDEDDSTTYVSETVYRKSIVSKRNRVKINDQSLWTNVSIGISFINTHR